MRGGRIGRGTAAALVVVGCLAAGCAASRHERAEDELPEFSAARLGEPGSLADEFLSPTEREAARDSWATSQPVIAPLDDPAEDDPFAEAEPPRAPESPSAPEAPRGPVGRAMDATGRFFVSILSVGVSLGMAVAPMFAMMGV